MRVNHCTRASAVSYRHILFSFGNELNNDILYIFTFASDIVKTYKKTV